MKYTLYLSIFLIFMACKSENKDTTSTTTDSDSPQETQQGGLQILVETITMGEDLGIQYTVHNNLSESIYLINQIFKDGTYSPDYIYTDIIDNSFCLYKGAPKIPVGSTVHDPEHLPYLTEVKSKGSFKEIVRIKLPPVPFSPYTQLKMSDTDYVYKSMRFEIGWLPASTDTKMLKAPDGKKRLTSWIELMHKDQKTLGAVLDMEIIVNFYK